MRLHWKLMVTYVLMVVVVMVCVQWYLDRNLRNFLVDHIADNLARDSRLASETWQRMQPSLDAQSIDTQADLLGERLALRLTLIDGDGIVVGDSQVEAAVLPGLDNHADRPEVKAARAGGVGRSLRFSNTLKTDMLYVARLVPGDDRLVLRLAMPLDEVEDVQGHVRDAVWLASLLGLVVAIVLAYGASRFESRPVVEMTRSAREMASGGSGGNIPGTALAARELHDLARALRDMYSQIQDRVAQLSTEKTRLEEAIAETSNSGRGTALEVELRGEERHIDIRVAPVVSERLGRGTVAVFYDISRQRRLETMRKDFVANVSHELRTPLTAIKGCAETLVDGAIDDDDAAGRFLQVIATHSDRLTTLLNDLLDLSRLESDELEIEAAPCNVRALAESSIESVAQIAARRGIAIDVSAGAEIRALCDRKLIEQALINLIENAVKYSAENGRVEVGARVLSRTDLAPYLAERSWSGGASPPLAAGGEKSAGAILLQVADTGIGIPSEAATRVFERFYRVDKGRSRKWEGPASGSPSFATWSRRTASESSSTASWAAGRPSGSPFRPPDGPAFRGGRRTAMVSAGGGDRRLTPVSFFQMGYQPAGGMERPRLMAAAIPYAEPGYLSAGRC